MRRCLALLLLSCAVTPAFAAESYDGCAGFIDSLPATITTQGVWCLRKDLSTAATWGAAITIATNNVTVDCNGFKIGGLGGGPTSQTRGVHAQDRLNATVRNCALRGFYIGVSLYGGGHLVEDNRVDQSLWSGINVGGEHNLVQRNRVFDTGSDAQFSVGIWAEADVRDNIVDGVAEGGSLTGIYVYGTGAEVRNNTVRNIVAVYGAEGIRAEGSHHSMIGNRVVISSPTPPPVSAGIIASDVGNSNCRDNLVAGFEYPFQCEDNGGNVAH